MVLLRTPEPAADLSDAPRHVAAVAAVGLLGLASAMGIGRFAFTPLLPLMQQAGQIDLTQGAWLASANYLGYLLGALVCTRWAVAPGRAARAGLAAVAVSTLAMGTGGGYALWLAWRLVAGAASAFVLVGVSAWALQALAAAQRPGAAGVVFAGVGSGIAVAGLVALEAALSHRAPEQTWRLLGALAAGVAWLGWRPFAAADAATDVAAASAGAPAAATMTVGAAQWDGSAWRLIAAYGAFGYGYILPATFLPAMARQLFDEPARFGAVWPLFGLAAAASTLLAARLARRASPRLVWAAAQTVMAAGVMAPAWSRSLSALLASAICVGGTFMVVTMAAMQQARQTGGAFAPRLMAAMTAAFAAGQLVGPLTVGPLSGGALGARDAVPWVPSLVAGAALLIGVALLVESGPRQRPG